MNSNDIEIYTDGGCHGNPGPGGWAFVILRGNAVIRENNGAAAMTTNNQMELTAAIEALTESRALIQPQENIILYTDSKYLQNGISSWINSWLRNGWLTKNKKPVKNRDLWQKLHILTQVLTIDWRWVAGHSGNRYNERCDQLVQAAIKDGQKKR